MIDLDRCAADLAHFNATGELPAAWAPEVDDEQLDEINRDPEIAAHFAELDAIESGCAEPPALGWTINIRVRPALDCNCDVPHQIQCDQHGPRE